MAGLKVGLLPLVSPQVSVKEWTWWTTRAAPGTNTASTVRDAPSVCPTSVSLPRATTSSAPPVVTSSDGAPAHCPTAVYTISSLFLFVWFLHKGKKAFNILFDIWAITQEVMGISRPKCCLCSWLIVCWVKVWNQVEGRESKQCTCFIKSCFKQLILR